MTAADGIPVPHADPWLLAVPKPASLLSCLQHRWPTPQLVHRLDQATSGPRKRHRRATALARPPHWR